MHWDEARRVIDKSNSKSALRTVSSEIDYGIPKMSAQRSARGGVGGTETSGVTLEGWKGYRPVDLHPARIFASVMAFNLAGTTFEHQSAFATRPGWREVKIAEGGRARPAADTQSIDVTHSCLPGAPFLASFSFSSTASTRVDCVAPIA